MAKAKRIGWAVAALLLAGGLLLWRGARPKGAAARITYDGETVLVADQSRDGEFALEQDPTVRFRVQNGAIAFVDATCPDKICEKAGALSRVGETAACLPRKTVVTVISAPEEREADAIAG